MKRLFLDSSGLNKKWKLGFWSVRRVSIDLDQREDVVVHNCLPALIKGSVSVSLCALVFLETSLCSVVASCVPSNVKHHGERSSANILLDWTRLGLFIGASEECAVCSMLNERSGFQPNGCWANSHLWCGVKQVVVFHGGCGIFFLGMWPSSFLQCVQMTLCLLTMLPLFFSYFNPMRRSADSSCPVGLDQSALLPPGSAAHQLPC